MHPIMVDERRKCENYMTAREKSGVKGWHAIEPAAPGAVIWKQKTATVGGNDSYTNQIRRVNRPMAGWIGKGGFQPHT